MESKCGFHIGDRVSLVVDYPDGKGELTVGAQGVICSFHPDFDPDSDGSYFAGVRWDEYIYGHRLGDHGTKTCDDGHGWWIRFNEIELVDETEISFEADAVSVGFLFD